jgi:hypothetical protein
MGRARDRGGEELPAGAGRVIQAARLLRGRPDVRVGVLLELSPWQRAWSREPEAASPTRRCWWEARGSSGHEHAQVCHSPPAAAMFGE